LKRLLLVVLVIAAVGAIWWFGLREADAPEPAKPPPPVRNFSGGSYPLDFNTLQQNPTFEKDDKQGPALSTEGKDAPVPVEPVPAPVAEGGLAVTGRVLDDRRRPVADAQVSLHLAYADDAAPRTARTDAQGAYRFESVRHPEASGPPGGVSGILSLDEPWRSD
jgi:hypothetical protein